MSKTLFLSFIVMAILTPVCVAGLTVERPRCEYLNDPLGIDVIKPRLSWIVQSDDRGQKQTAYRVLVASSPERLANDEGDLWDSGRVESDQTLHVEYSGKPLTSRMQCFWKVQAWDKDGKASPWSKPALWTMGLLNKSDWNAQWIADAKAVKRELAMPHNGFLSNSLWPLHVSFEPHVNSPNDVHWVVIDLGKAQPIDAVRLFPARPFGRWTEDPGFLFPVRMKIEAASAADLSDAKTVVDKTAADIPNPGTEAPLYGFAPTKARFLRLAVSRLRESTGNPPGFVGDRYGFALAEMEVLSGGKNVALGAKVSCPEPVEDGGWSPKFLVDGRTATTKGGSSERWPGSMLRKEFKIAGDIRRAMVYVTARGLYELRLNGKRVGDRLLAPEWTDYKKRIQVQAYDVTQLVKKGGNAVGAMLGEGWYSGKLGCAPPPGRAFYGVYPQLCLQLEVELADGQRQVVCSDATWRSTDEGPVRFSDILDGEEYDARREMPGWDHPGFDQREWLPVAATPLDNVKLVSQRNEPIRVIRDLNPVKMSQPKPGVYVFDIGQNMVGWCRLKLHGPAGTRVAIRYAEAVNPDGTIYTANLRSAAQTDLYFVRGNGEEVFEPHFTYHGFRYVEVTGLPNPPKQDDLIGRVFHSSSPDAGQFTCSNALLNQLMHNIVWVQRGNMHSVPTDCPQRDERLGWMGDIQAFSQTAVFNMDMAGFFTKVVQDIRDAQADDGRFPDYAPHPYNPNQGYAGAPAWADAGIVLPWRVYQNYADTRLLEEHFEAARRWIDFILKYNPNLLWLKHRDEDFGDWLNGDTVVQEGYPRGISEVPKDVLANAFFAHSTETLAKMAEVLGRKGDASKYARLAEGIKAAFNREYVAADGRIKGDTQAGYALALYFNLLEDSQRPKATKHMLDAIKRYKDHPSTGIQTTHRLMLELSRNGHHDEASRIINLRTVPSWGYAIDQGATTIWERWDGYVEGRGFQNAGMNSLNHWALGSVGEWIWREIVGIHPDDRQPGFKHFAIRPRPGFGVTSAKGEYDSIRGRIVSDWTFEHGKISLRVTVPSNTTATIYVPTGAAASVTEGDQPATKALGVVFLRQEADAAVFEVGSGSFHFQATR